MTLRRRGGARREVIGDVPAHRRGPPGGLGQMTHPESGIRRAVRGWVTALAAAMVGCEGGQAAPIPDACEEAPVAPTDVIGRVVALASGDQNGCAVFEDGSVRCWGDNSWGQLGDGTLVGGARPIQTEGLPRVQQVVVGTEHVCALTTGQCVWCWGGSPDGQLGIESLSGSRTPVLVDSLRGTLSLATYAQTNIALNLNQVLWWGQGTEGDIRVPTVLREGEVYRAVDLGDGFACGLRYDGRVECWGDNRYGQLGTGDEVSRDEPAVVEGLSGVTQIAVGTVSACALLSDGSLWCWGHNEFGQVGDGTTTNRVAPQQVELGGVVELSIYTVHVCARTSEGRVWCWGDNGLNEIGNGAVDDVVSTPWEIATISEARAVTVGADASCALVGEHDVWCWGFNKLGALGDDTYENSATPVKVVWGP